jgi:hypothetical protein
MAGTNHSIVFDDKENYDKEDKKKWHLWMLIFHNRMVLIRMMITLGLDGMIVSFLCLVLCSRKEVMFTICPLVQGKYPTHAKILGRLGRGSGEQMQITLVRYHALLVFSLIFLKI